MSFCATTFPDGHDIWRYFETLIKPNAAGPAKTIFYKCNDQKLKIETGSDVYAIGKMCACVKFQDGFW